MRRKIKHLIGYIACLICVCAFAGCSGKYVIVKDENGFPIQDAEVYAVSLSINSGPKLTNRKGVAYIPYIVQQAQWVAVCKEGYSETSVDVPISKSIEVVLTRKINIESNIPLQGED